MRVLHLFSNCKWTGPAEPALNLCWRLRALGVEAEFACAPDAGKSVNRVVESARERGIEPILKFHLRKHRHPLKNFQDVRRLRRYLQENPVDIVHCHLDNDHEIAARALRGLKIPLVRTSYEGVGLAPNRRRRAMLTRTAVLIEPSEIARAHDQAAYGLAPEQATVIPNAIDTHRFDPDRPLELTATGRVAPSLPPRTQGSRLCTSDDSRNRSAKRSVFPANAGTQKREHTHLDTPHTAQQRGTDAAAPSGIATTITTQAQARAHWNLPHDACVIGIVARMQTHRHFEDLLQAMRGVVDAIPGAHLIIVGRGTHQDKVAREPVRRLGLENHVTFTGYIEGDTFVAAIKAMDIGVYLVPGSDGTCRAAREILSMGKPLVVADRGMLREIVDGGSCGIVTDGRADALRDALMDLARDQDKRNRLGEKAREIAVTRYALDAQAAAVRRLYESITHTT